MKNRKKLKAAERHLRENLGELVEYQVTIIQPVTNQNHVQGYAAKLARIYTWEQGRHGLNAEWIRSRAACNCMNIQANQIPVLLDLITKQLHREQAQRVARQLAADRGGRNV